MAFGIFFKAKIPEVFLCLAKFTQPNFPSPNFLPISNSSSGDASTLDDPLIDVFLFISEIRVRELVSYSSLFVDGKS
jgi:hypothetical protein